MWLVQNVIGYRKSLVSFQQSAIKVAISERFPIISIGFVDFHNIFHFSNGFKSKMVRQFPTRLGVWLGSECDWFRMWFCIGKSLITFQQSAIKVRNQRFPEFSELGFWPRIINSVTYCSEYLSEHTSRKFARSENLPDLKNLPELKIWRIWKFDGYGNLSGIVSEYLSEHTSRKFARSENLPDLKIFPKWKFGGPENLSELKICWIWKFVRHHQIENLPDWKFARTRIAEPDWKKICQNWRFAGSENLLDLKICQFWNLPGILKFSE